MEEILYETDLKNEKLRLSEAVDNFGKSVKKKIEEKNKIINELKLNSENINLEKIENYKKLKNEELNNFKKELDELLNEVNDIITNITK